MLAGRDGFGAYSACFSDVDAFTQAIRAANVDYVPLAAGPYHARLTGVNLGSVVVQRAMDGAHVSRGLVARDRISLLTLLGTAPCVPPVVNGNAPGESDICFLVPGSELHAVCRSDQTWAALSLPVDEFSRLTEYNPAPANSNAGVQLLHIAPNVACRLKGALAALCDLAENMDGVFGRPGVGHALSGGIRELVTETIFSATPDTSQLRRITREAMRLLRLTEEYLHANIAKPIFLDEVSVALAVSPRKLHQVFVTACGLSPQVYLKRRRLMLVHRALGSGAPDARLVKSVALGHGFWHLGNFAREYRELFGESPSATLLEAREH
jgi:AraC-like DNA-binding protein